MITTPRIAIIGAGLCGLRLAQRLSPVAAVTVFEKSRGLGGRMSTRRAGAYQFDHGAQYFTARGAAFADFLAPYLENGTVAAWTPLLTRLSQDGTPPPAWSAPRYVAVPGMTALAKAMAQGTDVVRSVQIATIEREEAKWQLRDAEATVYDRFDWVISTAPALQTAGLMPQSFTGHARLAQATMQGCYSLMLGFDTPLPLDWDAAWVGEDPLAWIAVNSSKPGRSGPQCVLAQSSNSWAEANLERDQTAVRAELLTAFGAVTGCDATGADYISLHRWRYASAAVPAGAPFLLDAERGLATAGDWCGTGKVEAAFDSANSLSDAIVELLA